MGAFYFLLIGITISTVVHVGHILKSFATNKKMIKASAVVEYF